MLRSRCVGHNPVHVRCLVCRLQCVCCSHTMKLSFKTTLSIIPHHPHPFTSPTTRNFATSHSHTLNSSIMPVSTFSTPPPPPLSTALLDVSRLPSPSSPVRMRRPRKGIGYRSLRGPRSPTSPSPPFQWRSWGTGTLAFRHMSTGSVRVVVLAFWWWGVLGEGKNQKSERFNVYLVALSRSEISLGDAQKQIAELCVDQARAHRHCETRQVFIMPMWSAEAVPSRGTEFKSTTSKRDKQ